MPSECSRLDKSAVDAIQEYYREDLISSDSFVQEVRLWQHMWHRNLVQQKEKVKEEKKNCTSQLEAEYLWKELEHLWETENHLRKKEEQLRKKEEQLRKKEEQLREEQLLLITLLSLSPSQWMSSSCTKVLFWSSPYACRSEHTSCTHTVGDKFFDLTPLEANPGEKAGRVHHEFVYNYCTLYVYTGTLFLYMYMYIVCNVLNSVCVCSLQW